MIRLGKIRLSQGNFGLMTVIRIPQTSSDLATAFPYFEDWLKLAQESVAAKLTASSVHITASYVLTIAHTISANQCITVSLVCRAQAADLDKFLDFFDREYCHDPHTTQSE